MKRAMSVCLHSSFIFLLQLERWYFDVLEKTFIFATVSMIFMKTQLCKLSIVRLLFDSLVEYPFSFNLDIIGQLQTGFHDVAFQPPLPHATFPTSTFVENCGSGDSILTATRLGTVASGRSGKAPCKILFSNKPLFVSVELH